MLGKGDSTGREKRTFLQLLERIDRRGSRLIYFQFLTPLLLVVIELVNPMHIKVFLYLHGIRMFVVLVFILLLTMYSLYDEIKEKNLQHSSHWIRIRASHLFWLYFLQSLIVTIFVVDLAVSSEIGTEMFATEEQLLNLGMSNGIHLGSGHLIVTLMPVFTLEIAVINLFFCAFVRKFVRE